MDDFIKRHAAKAEEGWYAREAPPVDESCCPLCQRDLSTLQGLHGALFRCLDCPLSRIQCSRCILASHRARPFDRLRKWCIKRQMWDKATVPDLGIVLYLGHGGEPCPSIPVGLNGTADVMPRTREMVIVHENGHTDIRALFCQCANPRASEPVQLLESGMWPATWLQPRTAITLTTLDTFQSLSHKAHVNVNDYEAHLKRMTDAVLTEEVKDRYRELNNSAREFAFIRTCRRSMQKPALHLPSRSLAALCPACPQPGINMREGWKKRTEEYKYVDALHIAIDGNFHFNQKAPRSDPKDFPLTRGAAYFVHDEDFKKFLAKAPPPPKEPSTCVNFGALQYGKYKGNISGIVAILCRHMIVLPAGIINLHGGEKYLYVDFAVVSALQHYIDLDLIVACYDIICQYIINFRKRLGKEFTEEMIAELASIISAELPKMHAGVGKYHLPMHTKDCQKKFSLHLLPGACMDDGEWDERHWGIISPTSRRLKEMSVGHREDTMNDLSDDQNVQRIHGMVTWLSRKLERGETRLNAVTEYLATMESSITSSRDGGNSLLEDWRTHEAKWKAKVVDISQHHELVSDYPYEPPAEAALTSSQIAASIVEQRSAEGDRPAVGLVYVVHELLRLNEARYVLDLQDSLRAFAGQEKERSALATEVTDFCARAKVCDKTYKQYLQPCVDAALAALALDKTPAHFPRRDPNELTNTDNVAAGSTNDVAPSLTPPPEGAGKKRKREALTDEIRSSLLAQLDATTMPLPSDYHLKLRQHADMSQAVQYERSLQEGFATEALDDLRMHLTTHATLKDRHRQVSGVKQNTNWDRRLATKVTAINRAKERYRAERRILLLLGMKEEDSKFKRLNEADCKAFTILDVERKAGDSQRLPSWIWGDFSFMNHSDADGMKEFLIGSLRAHWFRYSAQKSRWTEEVNTACEEMFRTVQSYKHQCDKWMNCAASREKKGELGAAAYARR
ncbi:hypothetical protein LXA43DRAFT_905863 [Ganoderma leucocontextum]|nr:hypothetical protein LXA43DRAFT_905863 [Ganoderma leucocontextum]